MRPLSFLYPFSLIYRSIIQIRNKAYDLGIFKTFRVQAKVISVGNISAGGSGKTPFVIFLAKMLKKDHQKIAVLSRGYGRKSKGWILVHDGKSLLTDIYTAGDEPVMTAVELKDIPVAVCEDRVSGAQKLIKTFTPDVIILDDAFQHRRIHRDTDIVLLSATTRIKKSALIPAGYLREPLGNLTRGQVILLTKGDLKQYSQIKNHLLQNHYIGKSSLVLESCMQIEGIYEHLQGSLQACKKNPANLIGVTAIADPGHFFDSCEEANIIIPKKITYPDHYYFNRKNIDHWKRLVVENRYKGILVTMKDYVKILPVLSERDADLPLYVLKISFILDHSQINVLEKKLKMNPAESIT